MAQFARPDSDVTNTGTGGFGSIDESSPSDTDFWWGANNTAAELEVGLGNVTDPESSSGHAFRYRVAKTNAGTVDGGGNAVTVTARLLQGTTLIAADTAKTADGTWTQYALTLSGAEADAITDYTDLRLEFVTSASGGSPANRRGGAVSWAELEVPDFVSGTPHSRTPADTLGLGDARAFGSGKVFADVLVLADSPSSVLVFARAQDDTVGLADLADPVLTPGGGGTPHTLSPADTLALSDHVLTFREVVVREIVLAL